MSKKRWTLDQLAHACDVAAHGIESRTPFAGNPDFVDAMRMAAKVLRGDLDQNLVRVRISARADGTYLLLKLRGDE